ncbi:MAG: hypothetical protein NTY19_00510 [Planctomycetota bacterium]|nr:hypothetical protein [Planctomycetota bacterium]
MNTPPDAHPEPASAAGPPPPAAARRPRLPAPATARTAAAKAAVPQSPPAGDGDSHAARQPAPMQRADEVLRQLDLRRSQGHTWPALLGCRELVRALDQLSDPTPLEQALRLAATRREVEWAVEAEPIEAAVEGFTKSLVSWFHRDPWRRRQAQVVEHFQWLIQTELRVGERNRALALFQKVRQFLKLDPAVQRNLATAAAELGLVDLGSAVLYIAFLQGPDQGAEPRRKVLEMLRQAIRIDVAFPDDAQLPEYRRLNDALWDFRAETWCAAHRAIAAWRTGQLPAAWAIRQSVLDVGEADTGALTSLGLVAYLCRRWSDAQTLLTRASRLQSADADRARLYLSLTRVNQALAGQPETAPQDELRALLETEQHELAGAATDRAEAVDALWVRGAACAVLGRDAEALTAFAAAPVQHLAWRYAVLEMETVIRSGQVEAWQARLEQRARASAAAAQVGELLQTAWAFARGAWDEFRRRVGSLTVPQTGDVVADPDPAAVAGLLRLELALGRAEPLAQIPQLPVATECLSGPAHAWLTRLQAGWQIARGEFEPAAELLRQPVQWLAAGREARRLEAHSLGLQSGHEEEAGALFEQFGTAASATPRDRLAWGLWLSGRGDHQRAREVLGGLEADLPQSLELRLANAESELGAGGNGDLARRWLQADEGRPGPADLVYWTTPPQLSLYRPWQRRLPVTFWSWAGPLSPPRIGDMLQAAGLLIRLQQVEEGLAVVALVEHVVGADRPLLAPQFCELFRLACLELMAAGNVARACELQTRAAQGGTVDSQFAVLLAERLLVSAAAPADAMLEVLHDWVAGQRELSALLESPVAAALQKLLHVDVAVPATQTELQRYRQWTERLHQAQPDWDWPQRNLARAAARGERHEEVLQRIESLPRLTAADQALLGRSAWALERFERALAAFTAALDAEPERDLPDLRAWRGCARAAVRFGRLQADGQPLTENELEELLPDLPAAGDEAAAGPRIRAWHGAVLVAAGQGARAAEVLDVTTEEEGLQVCLPILRGVAWIQAGQSQSAVELWGRADGPLADDLLVRSLQTLVLAQTVSMEQRPQVHQAVQSLLRRQADSTPFHLAVAQRALAEDRLAAARESLVKAAAAPPLPILLAALVPWLQAERRFLDARLQLRAGEPAAALAAFRELASQLPWPGATVFWQAISALEAGQREAAERLLEDLLARREGGPDAQAQLALLWVREQRVDEAESLLAAVLQRTPGHPLALLAQAEMQARRGDRTQAMATLAELIQLPAAGASPRCLAAAHLALGQLHEAAAEWDAAEKCFRKAAELRTDWPVAAERLALFLALRAEDQPRRQEAARLLNRCLPATTHAVRLHLAAAVVADGLAAQATAAEHLRQAVAQPEFASLPAALQQETLTWSANLHLQLKEFGAAGDALRALEAFGSSTGGRMVSCWLLEVVHALNTSPLTPPVLEQAWSAAEQARQAAPDNTLAALLAALCRLLRADEEPETRAQVAALRNLTFATPEQALLAAIVRHLTGDAAALEEVEAAVSRDGGQTVDHHMLALLLANQQRQPALLVAEAEQLFRQPETACTPWSADDLVLVHSLDRIQKKLEAEALGRLQAWHAAGHGTARSRCVHSQLLARQATASLRGRDLTAARRLLSQAAQLLAASLGAGTAGLAETSPPSAGADRAETRSWSISTGGMV